MKIKKNPLTILFVFLILIFTSCIEESIIEVTPEGISQSEKLLRHIEANSNFIASTDYPAIITANELQANLASYLVVDVRSESDFNNGHIPGAINIPNNDLFEYVIEMNNRPIVLVSLTGQASAYYTTLLRVYGVENIFSLRFGFAVWNSDFSDIWIDTKDDKISKTDAPEFNNIQYPKNGFSPLPSLSGLDESLTAQEILEARVRNLLREGFNDNILTGITTKTISFDRQFIMPNRYVVCFGDESLYGLTPNVDPTQQGHTVGTVFYLGFPGIRNNLKSVSFLQTMPSDRPILIYSYTGQLSAIATAYLSILGYDVRSILFGAHNIFNQWSSYYKTFTDFYVFVDGDIRNYDYQ